VYKNRFTNQTDKKTIAEVQGMFQVPERQGWKWIPMDVVVVAQALGLAFQNVADAHMKRKQSSARSDDEASSADEQLAGAAKTKSKKALTIQELMEECLAFLLAMSVRQRSTVGAKGRGSSSTYFPAGFSCVIGHTNSGREVSIPPPHPEYVITGGAPGEEDSRFVDGGGDGEIEGCADAGSCVCIHTAEAKQQVSSQRRPEFLEFLANFAKDSAEVSLVGVTKPAYFRYIDAGRSNLDGRTGKVYAVFSWHDEGTSSKQPAVVFAVSNRSDSMTLDPQPMVFPKGYLSSECWSILNQDQFGPARN
jgi:hypothetical protein